MNTLVYLVRHTEPATPDDEWRFLGRSDPPLSPEGIEHAHELAKSLRPVRFASIYSSDLARALQTAQIIAGATDSTDSREGLPVLSDPRLREIDAGLWEGLTRAEAAQRYPMEHRERERDPLRVPFPGGESFEDLRRRVVPAFFEIVAHGGERILVVAHKGVNRVLLSELLGLPFDRLFSLRQEHGAVNIVEVPPQLSGARG